MRVDPHSGHLRRIKANQANAVETPRVARPTAQPVRGVQPGKGFSPKVSDHMAQIPPPQAKIAGMAGGMAGFPIPVISFLHFSQRIGHHSLAGAWSVEYLPTMMMLIGIQASTV
jgi:hypothetical protein